MSSTYQTLQHSPVFWAGGRSPLFMWAFRWQKSMQNYRPPFFFCTNTTVLHQALWLGLIAPDSNISHMWFWTSSTNSRGNPSKSFLKGSVICNFYCVFHGVGTAQFHWIQWEHIMVFSQELVGSICQLEEPKSPGHSSPMHQIIYHVFA